MKTTEVGKSVTQKTDRNAMPLWRRSTLFMLASALMLTLAGPALGDGNAERGARVFRACAACHSLEPGHNLSGPSLAGVWNRKAGSLASFLRYSDALKRSGQIWNEKSLETWLRDPQAVVPGNFMTFAGLKDGNARADLISFLRVASDDKNAKPTQSRPNPNLREAPQNARVKSIRHCRDTYFVTNAAGESVPFWEFNLRLKTDASASGPLPGQPVLVGTGMQGDRAAVVFASFKEISSFIREECQ